MAYLMMYHLYITHPLHHILELNTYLFYLTRVPRCIGISKFNFSEHSRTVINIITVLIIQEICRDREGRSVKKRKFRIKVDVQDRRCKSVEKYMLG